MKDSTILLTRQRCSIARRFSAPTLMKARAHHGPPGTATG
jgi:hypothetical protein